MPEPITAIVLAFSAFVAALNTASENPCPCSELRDTGDLGCAVHPPPCRDRI